jgi:CheY-like chemotaxis protein
MENKKILLIEDDDFLRELYMDLLTKEGYSVEQAPDGIKGLEKVKKGGWDLVLVDMIMPGMSGLELVKSIANESQVKPYKHLVFLTNLYNDDQKNEALSLGEAYLVKIQLTPDTFLQEVKKYLN